MLITQLEYDEMMIRKIIKEKTDFLPLPIDLKEKIYNIILEDEMKKELKLMSIEEKYLKSRKLIEIKNPNVTYKNIHTIFQYTTNESKRQSIQTI